MQCSTWKSAKLSAKSSAHIIRSEKKKFVGISFSPRNGLVASKFKFANCLQNGLPTAKRTAYCKTDCLLQNGLPTAKLTAYCKTNCLLQNWLPTAKLTAYCKTNCLLQNGLPTLVITAFVVFNLFKINERLTETLVISFVNVKTNIKPVHIYNTVF